MYIGRVRLGSSGLGGLLRFRMRRSIGLSLMRMNYLSSSGSSEKTTDEFGWACHAHAPARGREGFTTPSFGCQSNSHAKQLISSHLMSVIDGWVFLIRMSPIERAHNTEGSRKFTRSMYIMIYIKQMVVTCRIQLYGTVYCTVYLKYNNFDSRQIRWFEGFLVFHASNGVMVSL